MTSFFRHNSATPAARTLVFPAAVTALILGVSGCAGGNQEPAKSPEATVTVTSPAADETTPSEQSPSESQSSAEDSSSAPAKDEDSAGGASAQEVHGKVLLTSASAPSKAGSVKGKVIVARGGCIAFKEIPSRGKPLPLLAPKGSSYDGRNRVTLGQQSYRFGELVQLKAQKHQPGDAIPAQYRQRCGADSVYWVAP